MSDLFSEMQIISYLWGRKSIYNTIAKDNKAETIEFAEPDYTPTGAIETLLKQMQLKTGDIFKTVLSEQRKARIISVLSYTDFVTRVNNIIINTLGSGKGLNEFKKQINKGDLEKLVTKASYWETVFRTNQNTAYSYGNYEEMKRLDKFIAYEKYTVVIGDHPICKALKNEIREKGGFDSTFPPNGFNCTAEIIPISKRVAEARNIKPTPKSKQNPNNIKPDKGFGTHPKKSFLTLPKSTTNRLPDDTPKYLLKE